MITAIILSVLLGIDIGAFLVIGLERQIERKNFEAAVRRWKAYEQLRERMVMPSIQTPTSI